MQWNAHGLLAVVAVASLGVMSQRAEAQVSGGSVASGTYGASNGLSVNPYANPMANPFLNPYMAQFSGMAAGNPAQQANPALLMFAAQAANGGIGSGQLSGTRRGLAQPTRGSTLARPPAPEVQSSMVPGGTAARYFNRPPRPSSGTAQYYNRQGSYFPGFPKNSQ